jgi:ribosomal protein S18 acetylase RimI-like enzyme
MSIRRASVEDSPAIARVHVSTWQRTYRGIVAQGYLDQLSVANREQMWAEVFGRGSWEILVAEIRDDIVGFISFGKSRNDEPAVHDVGEIYAIYVAASHWSTGLGRALWEAALARLHELGFARLSVWVLAANEKAIRFYERMGCSPSAGSETLVEIGGQKLPELRYEVAIVQQTFVMDRDQTD